MKGKIKQTNRQRKVPVKWMLYFPPKNRKVKTMEVSCKLRENEENECTHHYEIAVSRLNTKPLFGERKLNHLFNQFYIHLAAKQNNNFSIN